MAKDIEYEIKTLLRIKKEIDKINLIKGLNIKAEFISNSKYQQLLEKQQLDEDTLYYIIDPEVGQYIDDYIE